MDDNSIIGRIIFGAAIRIVGIGIAVYVASYAIIAFLDAAERINAALPK